jgi:hypothetical protein
MAKLEGLFKYDGTFQGVTTVNSRAYGKHIRKARTKFTLSKEMKESSLVMQKANRYAKGFKDAIDPYRRDFRDGMLWQRLVSLFKTELQEKGKTDFKRLEGHELNKIHSLSWILMAKATVTQADGMLSVYVTSRHVKNPTRGLADGYQQTLIILYADSDLQFETFAERAIISLNADPGEQTMHCAIPKTAKMAIVVLKCNFSKNEKPMDLQKGMGMRVLKVVELA